MAHFPHFLGIFFSKNLALLCKTPHGPLTSNSVSEKTNEPFPRTLPDRRMERRKNGRMKGEKDRRMAGQTLIHAKPSQKSIEVKFL